MHKGLELFKLRPGSQKRYVNVFFCMRLVLQELNQHITIKTTTENKFNNQMVVIKSMRVVGFVFVSFTPISI
jgi:hypothetical protein